MNPELTVVKTAYEDEGMSPEQIAQDQDLDLAAVKGALMQYSSKYRKACGKEDELEENLNFDNDQLRRVNSVIYDLALGAEDEHLRFKAATYIRDDKKGRKEIVKGIQSGPQFNMLFINEQLKKVNQVGDRIISSISQRGQVTNV